MPLSQEKQLDIAPISAEAVMHNTRVISNVRTLTASLFGVVSGILGLESYHGFLFYILGTTFVSFLIYTLSAEGKPEVYFQNVFAELWSGDIIGNSLSFVMTWTLFFNLCKA